MNESQNASQPYQMLGKHLKYLREQLNETIAEVSGAVEIDIDELERIETGATRPSEDVLMLLISHFNMQDNEAVQLWESAGYEEQKPSRISMGQDDTRGNAKPIMMLLAMDVRTMYSDGLDVLVNKAGMTLTFTQNGSKQPLPVAKVGVSIEQAENIVATLQQAILQSRFGIDKKQLPPPQS